MEKKNQKARDARIILVSLEAREIYGIVMNYFTFSTFLLKRQIKFVLLTVAVYSTYFYPLLVVLQFRSLLAHRQTQGKKIIEIFAFNNTTSVY